MYTTLLRDIEERGLIKLPVEREWAKNTYWMYGIVLKDVLRLRARDVMKKLEKKTIQTRPFFFPMHMQPVFTKAPWYRKETLPVSEKLYEYGFYLPSGLTLKEDAIEEVTSALKEVLDGTGGV